MDNYVITEARTLTEIADAIRSVVNSTDKMSLSQFSTSIKEMGGGRI